MVTGFFILAAQAARSLRTLALVIAACALGALLMTIATMPAAQPMVSVADAAHMQLVNDEHAAVSDYLRTKAAADRAADVAAQRDYAEARAIDAPQQPAAEPQHTARSDAPARKPAKVALVAAPVPVKPAPVVAVGPPLQLQAMLAPVPASKRPVVERVRSVIATVERIPRWVRVGVQDAADWVTDVPGQIIRLPERRFL